MQLMDRLRDALQLQQFLQYCEELPEWIQEKNIIGQDETCRNAKTVLSKWTRHQAFVAEIASKKIASITFSKLVSNWSKRNLN